MNNVTKTTRTLATLMAVAAILFQYTLSGALASQAGKGKASPQFGIISAKPFDVSIANENSLDKTGTRGMIDAKLHALVFKQKSIRLVVHTGPSTDMLSYRINGLRNPNIILPRGSTISIVFTNDDDDMFHNIRFGVAPAAWPSDASALLHSSSGTPQLPHKSETIIHGETLVLKAPSAPGAYAYFCTVRGHAKGGMHGAITIR